MNRVILLAFTLASLLAGAYSRRQMSLRHGFSRGLIRDRPRDGNQFRPIVSQDTVEGFPFGRRRRTFIISDPFSSSFSGMGRPSSPFSSIIGRPRYFFWNTESYHNWTKWSSCRSSSCRRFRYRKCQRGHKCPAHFLVEMKPCEDAPGCRAEKMNVTLERQVTENCGFRPRLNLKIMGGRTAVPNSWPWQASLILSGGERVTPSCGATLIGSQHVLTAAHCLVVATWPRRLPIGKKFSPRRGSVRIRLGDHDIRYPESHERLFDVKSIIIHPDFKLSIGSCRNDVALLKLNQSVRLHTHVNVACLPSKSMRLPSRQMCTALGWGVVRETRRNSIWDFFRKPKQVRAATLQQVDIPLVTYRDCRREYPEFALNGTTHVCAGGGGKDTCRGDSGGPLMCPVQVQNQTRWFLYGVTSFGSQSGCGRSFGVYSRVSHFTEWIEKMQRRM